MFDLDRAILEWRSEMLRAGIRNIEALDELESHLREHMERLRPEMRNAASFQEAVQKLGDKKVLKKEFAKVGGGFLQQLRGKPLGLNLLSAWLILVGADGLRHWVRQVGDILAWGLHGRRLFSTVMLSLIFLSAIGIARRKNFWRYVAVSLLIFFVKVQAVWFCFNITRHDHLYSPVGVSFGLIIPGRFLWCYNLLLLSIFTSGLVYLARNPVKKLLGYSCETEIA